MSEQKAEKHLFDTKVGEMSRSPKSTPWRRKNDQRRLFTFKTKNKTNIIAKEIEKKKKKKYDREK